MATQWWRKASFSLVVPLFSNRLHIVCVCLILSLCLSYSVFVCVWYGLRVAILFCLRSWIWFIIEIITILLHFLLIMPEQWTHTHTSYDYKSLMNSNRKTIRIYPKLIKIRSILIDRTAYTLQNTQIHTTQCISRWLMISHAILCVWI